jgi:uncharacterized protein (TIGR03083 family)
MEFADYLDALRRDGDLLADAAARGLDAAVPSCPGWTVADLLAHTGSAHRNRARVVAERLTGEPADDVIDPAEATVDWYREGLDHLIAALEASGPEAAVWTWYPPDQRAGFWARRMAHETLIHRIDAELASGQTGLVDAGLAADGVDEVLNVYVGGVPAWATFTPGDGVARLRSLDPVSSWDVRLGSMSGTSTDTGNTYTDLDAIVVVDPVGDPAVEVTGTAADLDLWLWGRGPIDRLEVAGDAAVAHGLRRVCAEAME